MEKNERIYEKVKCVFYYGIIAVTMLLNIIRIFDITFWGDECFSILLAQTSMKEIIQVTAQDVHPPLYYMILRIFYLLFGDERFIYHLVSVLPILLMIVFGMTKIKREFGRHVSIIFILLSTFLECTFKYNVEVRMYTWAAFFVLLCYWYAYELIRKSGIQHWGMFIISGLSAAYTHYYALIAVALIYLGVFIYLIMKDKKYIKHIAICSGITIIGYLPWFGVLLKSFQRSKESWWSAEIPNLKAVIEFLVGKGIVARVFIGFCIIIIIWSVYQYVVKKNGDINWYWTAIGLLVFIGLTLIGLGVSYLLRPLFIERYLFVGVGCLNLSFSILVCEFLKNTKGILCFIILILLIGVPKWYKIYQEDSYMNEGTVETLNYEKENFSKDDVLVSSNWLYTWRVFAYYFPEYEYYNMMETNWQSLSNKEIWIFYQKELDKEIIDTFHSWGRTVEFCKKGILGEQVYYLYKVQ